MAANCFTCGKDLQGNWNMTEFSPSNETNGRNLGITANFLYSNDENSLVNCYCNDCWKKAILKLPFIIEIVIERDALKITSQDNANLKENLAIKDAQISSLKEEIKQLSDENILFRDSIKIDGNSENFNIKAIDYQDYKRNFIDSIFICSLELYSKMGNAFKAFNDDQTKQVCDRSDRINIESILKEIIPKLKDSGEEALSKIRTNLAGLVNTFIEETQGKVILLDKAIGSMTEIMEQSKLFGMPDVGFSLEPSKLIRQGLEKEKSDWHNSYTTITSIN